MVALMAGIAIMAILSAVAAQNWGDVVRRDNEAEMIFRAEDLVRGLKRFQKDKGKLPNELKELAEPGQKGQYFVRRLWKDPLVKGGKWQLLYAAPGGGLIDPTAPGLEDMNKPGTQAPAPEGGSPIGLPDIVKKDDGSSEISGLPIAGVKTRCTDPPFRRYKDKDEYSQWVFSVFDVEVKGSQIPGQGAGPAGAPRPRGQGGAGGDGQPTFPPR